MDGVGQQSGFLFADSRMRTLVAMAERAAACDSKVLITGESGVGKDLVARHIHTHADRASRPFVVVNCPGLTESLLESELFGHVKGSFTGAYRDKPGKLQIADRGTLFLDEVGEMSLRMQALLLRFLENGEIQAVGSDESVAKKVDVRVVAATNRNLAEMITAGQFREDLFYRLRVIHLEVPPLRERPDDIRLLVAHFIERSGRAVTIDEEALRAFERYRWPGNVRELQNVIEQTVWLAPADVIHLEHLPPAIRTAGETVLPSRERRTRVADQLYTALVVSGYSFCVTPRLQAFSQLPGGPRLPRGFPRVPRRGSRRPPAAAARPAAAGHRCQPGERGRRGAAAGGALRSCRSHEPAASAGWRMAPTRGCAPWNRRRACQPGRGTSTVRCFSRRAR